MDTSGCGNIPGTLPSCITFLVKALPLRSVPKFIELAVGAMLTEAGFFTQAYLTLSMKQNWSGYYTWIETGNGPGWQPESRCPGFWSRSSRSPCGT